MSIRPGLLALKKEYVVILYVAGNPGGRVSVLKFRIMLLLFAAVAAAGAVSARPKIGLVLGGGGARGLAHVGTLELLEELHIPVDCIAGTSMGSIIGGLYAAGLTPEEIKSAMLSMNWDDLFQDQPPRDTQCFRRKQDDRSDFYGFVLGLRGFRPALPRGLVAGQKLTLSLKHPGLFTTSTQDFDDLPVPFRAVATDVETGELVILSKGSLVHALRASMAIPGVFNPVRLDGRLLVDGGLLRNLPIDVVKEMGADVIIAVDVGSPVEELTAENINSIFSVSQQAFNIFLKETSDRWRDQADVLLQIPLQGISAADFKMAPEIIRAGEEAAETIRSELERYSVGDDEYRTFLDRHRSGPSSYPRIDGIEVVNHSSVNDYVISRRVHVEAGKELDPVQLETDLNRLYGLDVFELVDFGLREKNGRNTLRILAEEKLHGANVLLFGLDYFDDLEGRVDFGLLARFTRLELNRLGGEWRTDVRLGLTRGASTEWYQPLEPSRAVFLAPVASVWYDTQDIYDGDKRAAEYRVRTLCAGLDAGIQLGSIGEVRFGVRRGETQSLVISGRAGAPEETTRRGGWAGSLVYDLLDYPDLPRKGGAGAVRVFLARRDVGDDDDYDRVSVDLAQFASAGRNVFFGTFAGGSSLGSEIPFDDRFVVGGPFSFSGLKPGQARGMAFGVARLGYYRILVEGKVLVGNSIFTGGWGEAGNVWQSPGDAALDDVVYGGALVLGAATVLGPITVGYGRNEDDVDSFFLTIGRQFGNVYRGKP